MKEFVISLLLYSAYAGYATVTKDNVVTAFAGIAALAVCCVINRRTLADLWSYAMAMLRKLMKKS